MEEFEVEDDGWVIIKSGKYLVKANPAHIGMVLETKRLIANRKLIAEIASYADEVRVVA